jgi:hypothetical protein
MFTEMAVWPTVFKGQHVRLKPLEERHQFERREGSLRGNLSM